MIRSGRIVPIHAMRPLVRTCILHVISRGVASSGRLLETAAGTSWRKPKVGGPVYLPDYIEIKSLSKLLNKSIKEVTRAVLRRGTNDKEARSKKSCSYLRDLDGLRYEFPTPTSAVVPYSLAAAYAKFVGFVPHLVKIDPDDIGVEDGEGEAVASLVKNSRSTVPSPSKANKQDAPATIRKLPIVTVMGHIDHGKTTLLDHLSNMKVAASEPGFITQDVRAVTLAVKPFSDNEFTFLDTPGHFHFDRMRENSAVVADAVLLVIAADEGLLAQSYDVIQWALEYDLPMIVCINKIDLCTPARLSSLRRRIQKAGVRKADHLLEISALHGTNIDQLKETLAIVTDKCGKLVNRHDPAEAVVLESSYKPGAGIILKALIQCGTLEVGQYFVCGYIKGKVRAILDPMGNRLKVAHPGCLVEVMGGRQSEIDASIEPPLGDTLFVVGKDRADEIMEVRHLQRRFSNARMEKVVPEPPMTEEERKDIEHQLRNPHLLTPVEEEKSLSLIIKADTAGALDVLRQYLLDIPGITILSSSIGEVSLKDLDNSIHADYCPIICYRITPTMNVRRTATNKKVKIYFDNVLHRLIDMAREQAGAEKPFVNMKPIADQGKEEVIIM